MKTKPLSDKTFTGLCLGLAFTSTSTLPISPLSAAEQACQSEHMVITASRVSQTIDDALASVMVLDRDDIQISQATDLLELLRLQAGVDLARTGGAGSQTSIFLRGTNANHTLVLVESVRPACQDRVSEHPW